MGDGDSGTPDRRYPATRDRRSRRISGLVLVLFASAWTGGAFWLSQWPLGLVVFQHDHDPLVGDYVTVAFAGCAVGLPAAALVISLGTGRRIAAGFFLVLGIFGLVYAMAFGTGAASDIQRRTERSPEPLTSEYAPCYSGSNDCPGG